MSLPTSITVAIVAAMIIAGFANHGWSNWSAFFLGILVCAAFSAVIAAEKAFKD